MKKLTILALLLLLFPYAAVAENLGCTEAAARGLVARGLASLAALLGQPR